MRSHRPNWVVVAVLIAVLWVALSALFEMAMATTVAGVVYTALACLVIYAGSIVSILRPQEDNQ